MYRQLLHYTIRNSEDNRVQCIMVIRLATDLLKSFELSHSLYQLLVIHDFTRPCKLRGQRARSSVMIR